MEKIKLIGIWVFVILSVGAIFFASISDTKIYANNEMSEEGLFMNNDLINQSNESINYTYNRVEPKFSSSSSSSGTTTVIIEANESEKENITEEVIRSSSSDGNSYIPLREEEPENNYTLFISLTDPILHKDITITGDNVNSEFVINSLNELYSEFGNLPNTCFPLQVEPIVNCSDEWMQEQDYETSCSFTYQCYDGTIINSTIGRGDRYKNPCDRVNHVISFKCSNGEDYNIYRILTNNITQQSEESEGCRDVDSIYNHNKSTPMSVINIETIRNLEKEELFKYQCANGTILNSIFNNISEKYKNPCGEVSIKMNYTCNNNLSFLIEPNFNIFYKNYGGVFNYKNVFWSEQNYPCSEESNYIYKYTNIENYTIEIIPQINSIFNISIIGTSNELKNNGKIYMVMYDEGGINNMDIRYLGVEINGETSELILYTEFETFKNILGYNEFERENIWW